jgi:predicted RNase H-like nuclease (RuvC/YqgF family)
MQSSTTTIQDILYSNFDSPVDNQEQQQQNKLKQDNDRLRKTIEKMKQENDRLRLNISRLYLTAKQEIESRDAIIQQLQHCNTIDKKLRIN